jgi:hypothetical protein
MPTEFPAITICNLNPFDVNKNVSYIEDALKFNNISIIISLNESQQAFRKVNEAAKLLKAFVLSDQKLNSSSLEQLGFTIDAMLISCFYNGLRCTAADFSWTRTFEYGNCYTFNGLYSSSGALREPNKTSKAGPSNGLTMELFVGIPGRQDFYTYQYGAYVIVHNRTSRVPLVKYEGMPVKTGAATNIGVTRTFYKKKEAPYSECRANVDTIMESDSVYFKMTSNITKYTQKLCYEICLQYEYIIPLCKCADPSVPIIDRDLPICNSLLDLSCVDDKRNLFEYESVPLVCDKYCPLECSSQVFSTSISLADYPTEYYINILRQTFDFNNKFTNDNTSVFREYIGVKIDTILNNRTSTLMTTASISRQSSISSTINFLTTPFDNSNLANTTLISQLKADRYSLVNSSSQFTTKSNRDHILTESTTNDKKISTATSFIYANSEATMTRVRTRHTKVHSKEDLLYSSNESTLFDHDYDRTGSIRVRKTSKPNRITDRTSIQLATSNIRRRSSLYSFSRSHIPSRTKISISTAVTLKVGNKSNSKEQQFDENIRNNATLTKILKSKVEENQNRLKRSALSKGEIKKPMSSEEDNLIANLSTKTLAFVNASQITSSVLMINVFYEELRYTLIEEVEATNLETLIGIVGEH